ncbi:MAG: PAS domain S-box protein [Lentimicrobiaceae bacterium]|nr:PAS domain S-box protein [Lentimicrobiaceae bacterium]
MNKRRTIFLAIILLYSFGLKAQDQKRVLLISSYNSGFPTYFQQINGIKSILDTANTVIDAEFMDSKRFIDNKTHILFYETLKNKLSFIKKYDAVLTADDDAFNFALRYQDELFKNTPIVFFGVNNTLKALEQDQNPNVTGVIEAVSMQETIGLMINLFPETKSVYCITDSTSSGLSDLKLYRQIARQMTGIDFKEINLSTLSYSAYQEKLKTIPSNVPVLLLSAYQDEMHQTIEFNETLSILKKNLHAPLFHLWEHGMGSGILGGKLISHTMQGQTAATMVYHILKGQPVAAMKVINKSPNVFQFDYNQLTRYKIPIKKLPPGSVIINSPETFFHKYQRIIFITTAAFGILFILIISLIINILKRRKIAQQLKKQNANFARLNSELLFAKGKAEEGEKKFKQLFFEHSAVKLLIDAETGHIYDANPAAIAFYGWSLKQLTQMNISDINTLTSYEIKHKMKEARETTKVHFEFRHRKADGSVADVEVFSSKVNISGRQYLYSIVHDVSEKKIHEHKIRLLSRSVEQSPIAIVITDKKGIIEYVNPAFTKISGYTFDEAIGNNPRILKSGNHPVDMYKSLWNTILSSKTWVGEVQNKKKSGEHYWVSLAISPIYNHHELTNFVAVSEDITEKKKIVEDLIIEKQKAEEASQLKTEFLNNMSHEIRTPMNGIIGFSEMLCEENIDHEQRKLFTDIIVKSSFQLLNIIDDILEISRLETHQIDISLETFSLNTLLKELCFLFEKRIKEKGLSLSFKTALDDNASYITSDKAKITRVISNLIENALKFTSKGSIETGYVIKDNRVSLFVKDTGIGISPGNIERIFDRFAQEEKELSRKYGGLGLGLAISKENAKLLNGDITVESEKNVGSTFYLTIPYLPSEKKPAIPVSVISKINNERNVTILIAEDEEINYLYIETLLTEGFKSKIKLLRALNGKEAIETCMATSEIDLILMDIKMPVINGLEATKEIKKRLPELPIIALTAYSTESDKQLALSAGCNAFISKPIHKTELFDLLNKHLLFTS